MTPEKLKELRKMELNICDLYRISEDLQKALDAMMECPEDVECESVITIRHRRSIPIEIDHGDLVPLVKRKLEDTEKQLADLKEKFEKA